jgi:hypothetical protein
LLPPGVVGLFGRFRSIKSRLMIRRLNDVCHAMNERSLAYYEGVFRVVLLAQWNI